MAEYSLGVQLWKDKMKVSIHASESQQNSSTRRALEPASLLRLKPEKFPLQKLGRRFSQVAEPIGKHTIFTG